METTEPVTVDAQEPAPNRRYGTADAEWLWLGCYGSPARATQIASEADAVFRLEQDDGCSFLLRISPAQGGSLALQAALLDHLAQTSPDMPTPRVRRGRDGSSVVMIAGGSEEMLATSFLRGMPLARSARAAALQPRVCEALGRLDQAMATFGHVGARRRLLWNVAAADQVLPLVDAIRDRKTRVAVRDALTLWSDEAAPVLPLLRSQVIHNDFNPSNILVDEDGGISGIIDFGDMLEAPLVCDLATCIAYQRPSDGFARLIADAVEAFGKSVPLTREEIAVLPILVRARAAMVLVIGHWRASLTPEGTAYLTRNVPGAASILAASGTASSRRTS